MKLSRAVAALMFLLVPLSLQGTETYKLDILAFPALPGIQRHVQVYTVASADKDGTETHGRAWHSFRLFARDVKALHAALYSWAQGAPPANPPTVWRKQYSTPTTLGVFELTERTTPERYLILTLSAASYIAPPRGSGAEPVSMSEQLRFQLSEAEALDIAAALDAWTQGWEGNDGDLWRRVEGD